jgi:hypothetical protein
MLLLCMIGAGFSLRAIPLLQHAEMNGDPLIHYEYSMALMNDEYSILVPAGNTGNMIELYYPPLFHFISLLFFLAFPAWDPFALMKVLASLLSSLQIIPIYLIVKRITASSPASLLAAFVMLGVRSDFEMLAWGGYANILGLLLIACVIYAIIADKPVVAGFLGFMLAMTHHLSTLLLAAVLAPYFLIVFGKQRRISKSFLSLSASAILSYLIFYRFALPSIYFYYTHYVPVYDQGAYVTSYIFEQVGPLLIATASGGIVSSVWKSGREYVRGKLILAIWVAVPILLAYAYMFGVQWHGVRWIHFIPQPLVVWTGLGIRFIEKNGFVLACFVLLFTVQLLLSVQGYYSDIFRYAVP